MYIYAHHNAVSEATVTTSHKDGDYAGWVVQQIKGSPRFTPTVSWPKYSPKGILEKEPPPKTQGHSLTGPKVEPRADAALRFPKP